MLTLSWRRAGTSSALALALVVGLPALAQAQLFPNLWIQRERTPCANEPPFYAHIRHNYYGYYPTCWRKFPEGWACPCPNPELPDAAASFVKRPRDEKPALPPRLDEFDQPNPLDRGQPGAGADPGRRGLEDAGELPLPRSVLGPLEDNPRQPGNTNPPPAAPGPGQQTVPGRGTAPNADPFAPLQPNLPRPNASSSPRGTTPEVPALEPPQEVTSEAESVPANDAFGDPGKPVLALPEMPKPPSVAQPGIDPALATTTMPTSLSNDVTTVELPPMNDPAPAAAPAQAPRRPSLIGSLFNNMGNWRRR